MSLLALALSLSPGLLPPSGDPSQETFDIPNDFGFVVGGLNDGGDVVGWSLVAASPGSTTRPFRRLADGSVRYVDPPTPSQFPALLAISNSGDMLLGNTAGQFLIGNGPPQTLPTFGGTVAYSGRSDAGVLVGVVQSGVGFDGALYDGAALTSVPVAGFDHTRLQDVNAAGLAVGWCQPDEFGFGARGVLYDSVSGTTTLFDMPGASATYLRGVNDAGEVVGSALFNGEGERAIHFDGQSWSRLEVFGRTGTSYGIDIDNTGRIVGTYFGQHLGQEGTHGFLLTDSGPEPYCQANANSSGEAAAIHAAGSTSVAADDLVLQAGPAPANAQGLFFYGLGRQEVPFGDGFLCVAGSLARLGAAPTSAAGYALSRFDLGAASGLTAGTRVYAQYWFRDVAAGGAGFSTSRGLTLELAP